MEHPFSNVEPCNLQINFSLNLTRVSGASILYKSSHTITRFSEKMNKDQNDVSESSLADQLEAFLLLQSISIKETAFEFVKHVLFDLNGLIYAILGGVLVYFYWKLFHQPFNLFRDFSDLGFEETGKPQKQENDASRRNTINEMRRRRKMGKLPPAYPNGWFSILESDDLKKGTAKEVYALGENLVAWRGASGCAYVADAYCPHIGAHLGVGGQVRGECIQCPFHSWTFDGKADGKLSSIPYAEKLPDFVKIKMWKVVEANGYIFVWYHAESQNPTWYPDKVAEVDNGSWSYRGRSDFRVVCHIQEIPENGADIAHLNVLHSDLAQLGDNPKTSFFKLNFIKHVWSASWKPNTTDPERRHEGYMKVSHHIQLFGWFTCFQIDVDIWQTGPGIVTMHFNTFLGKGVFIQAVTPMEPLLQRIVHRFYSSTWIIHPLAKFILDGEAKQIARDIRIWNRKCYLDKPVLTKEDYSIKTFRRWFSQFYSPTKQGEKQAETPTNYFTSRDDNGNKLKF